MPGPILVVNAGSSSVKFQVFDGGTPGLARLLKGQVDGIGSRPRLKATRGEEVLVDELLSPAAVAGVPGALSYAGDWLRRDLKLDPCAVGHRVVHGGPDFADPVRVDTAVLRRLEKFIPLAPLHQPHNLSPIRTLLESRPGLPQVACFDTAFHRGHGPLADHYAIPRQYWEQGVRRYGFHGLSYQFVSEQLKLVAPRIASGRVLIAHLGSGASMCAIREGRSVESTMGFTALDGLPMGTRPGQIDPGVILYLISQLGMSASEVQGMLYGECGLKGLSGISNDVRDLQASTSPDAAFALDYFSYRIALNAGMLVSALEGVDGFVFTAGIGENSPAVREAVIRRLEWLGMSIDTGANALNQPVISGAEGKVPVLVIPTDEERMIAIHTAQLIGEMHLT